MTTFRNRLRLSFVAVAVGAVLVAALVILTVGRGINQRDARDLAVSVASSSAASITQLIEARSQFGPGNGVDSDNGERGGRSEQRRTFAAAGIARSLSVVGASLIAIEADGSIRDVSSELGVFQQDASRVDARTAPEIDGRLDDRSIDAIAAFTDDLVAGDGFTTNVRGRVLAGVPVAIDNVPEPAIEEGTTLVVVASRRLGRFGLGPLGPGLLLTFVLALIAALSLAEALARRLRGPLLAVSSTSRAIAAGNLDARVALPSSTDEEVAQIGETIDDLAEQLGKEREQRQQFLLDISHELRTPLTSVRGHAELLSDDPPDSLGMGEYSTEVTESGRVIERESKRMERLIEDLLDLTRFDTGQMSVSPAPVDVATSVTETVGALRAKADQRGITVETFAPDEPVTALADRARLDQVIANLVGNAIDFAASTVEVETTTAGDEVTISVRDDGPGLGAEPEQFFERHRRGAQPADRSAGLGVGLSIVETFVTAMNGTVTAANRTQGAVFTVTLPHTPPPTL